MQNELIRKENFHKTQRPFSPEELTQISTLASWGFTQREIIQEINKGRRKEDYRSLNIFHCSEEAFLAFCVGKREGRQACKKRIAQLCASDDEKVALKACCEYLDRFLVIHAKNKGSIKDRALSGLEETENGELTLQQGALYLTLLANYSKILEVGELKRLMSEALFMVKTASTLEKAVEVVAVFEKHVDSI